MVVVTAPAVRFVVEREETGADGVLYLKLADGRGCWVFDQKPNWGVICAPCKDGRKESVKEEVVDPVFENELHQFRQRQEMERSAKSAWQAAQRLAEEAERQRLETKEKSTAAEQRALEVEQRSAERVAKLRQEREAGRVKLDGTGRLLEEELAQKLRSDEVPLLRAEEAPAVGRQRLVERLATTRQLLKETEVLASVAEEDGAERTPSVASFPLIGCSSKTARAQSEVQEAAEEAARRKGLAQEAEEAAQWMAKMEMDATQKEVEAWLGKEKETCQIMWLQTDEIRETCLQQQREAVESVAEVRSSAPGLHFAADYSGGKGLAVQISRNGGSSNYPKCSLFAVKALSFVSAAATHNPCGYCLVSSFVAAYEAVCRHAW
eukprot:Skav223505  [mRNA]  locus=scaffold1160:158940:175426:- [translate_table: standard]